MIAITGSTGQLGRLVIAQLIGRVAPSRIAGLARDPAKASVGRAEGVSYRHADYMNAASLDDALKGIEKLLLISSNELGQRAVQHRRVIDAAKRAGVKLIAYTSVLHADVSPLALAAEHRDTEAALKESGVPYTLLRNGWYTENYTMALGAAVERGAIAGSAGTGRISSAARDDYAAAAAEVMAQDGQPDEVYELAGDDSYTLADLAAEAGRQSGKAVVYADMPEADYKKVLIGAGLPEPVAALLSDSDAGASKGALYDTSRQLSALIGRPTTPLPVMVTSALGR